MAYKKLLNAVIKDLEKDKERIAQGKATLSRSCSEYGENCMKLLTDYAEKGNCCGHSCEYCEKFKWVIDRAKLYGEKLNISWKDIMQSWDEDRNYWYMNYYQECNQPKINSDNVFAFESAKDMREKVGTEFICPCCKGVSTNPYECNSGVEVQKGKKCDWKSYGFIQLNLAFLYCKEERKGTKCFMPKAFMS